MEICRSRNMEVRLREDAHPNVCLFLCQYWLGSTQYQASGERSLNTSRAQKMGEVPEQFTDNRTLRATFWWVGNKYRFLTWRIFCQWGSISSPLWNFRGSKCLSQAGYKGTWPSSEWWNQIPVSCGSTMALQAGCSSRVPVKCSWIDFILKPNTCDCHTRHSLSLYEIIFRPAIPSVWRTIETSSFDTTDKFHFF